MAISGGDGSIILTTKVDESGIKNFGKNAKTSTKNIGESFKKLGQVIATAFAVKKIYEFGKAIVSAYADYEQLVGGVETLFGESSKKMLEYANQAYKTAGLSANAYMETATSFSASLLSSLGGDTEKAADYANRAIIDMSDNANKMGTSMEMIQNAYQGFAKQNYTMLDNLKLGYGGTKTEMERLVRDASQLKDVQAELGVTVDANSTSFGNIVNAISVMQKQMGIAGTTADEAEKTISGSLNMLKSSWQNLLTVVSGVGNLDSAIQNLVYSLEKYLNNIIPVVERMLIGIGYAIERIAPILVERIANALVKAIPSLLVAVYQMIIGIGKGIYQGIVSLIKGETTEAFATQSETIANSVKNQEALTDAVKDTAKEQKKLLAGFDDLEILSQNASGNASGGAGVGGVSGTEGLNVLGGEIDEAEYTSKLALIGRVTGWALVGLGIILMFSGHPFIGIGMVASGFVLSAGAAAGGAELGEKEKQKLAKIGTVVGVALIGLGVLLLFTKLHWKYGLAMIATGAMAVYSAYSLGKFSQDVKTLVSKILLISGIVAFTLGVILLFINKAGIWKYGLGLMALGVAEVVVALSLGGEELKGELQSFVLNYWKELYAIGALMVVVGVVLLFVSAKTTWKYALTLIVAGIAVVATTTALGGDALKRELQNFAVQYWKVLYGIGALMAIAGIVLLFCKQWKYGFTLLIAGIAVVATTTALGGDALKRELQNFVVQYWKVLYGIGALMAIAGIVLLFCKQWKYGLTLLIAGIASVVGVTALGGDKLKAELQNFVVQYWKVLYGIGALITIAGIVLLFCKQWKYGLTLLIAGIASVVGVTALGGDALKRELQNFIVQYWGIIYGISALIVVVGIVLLFCSVWGAGLTLIAAGIGAIVGTTALGGDELKQAINDTIVPFKDEILTIGALLFVVGVVLLFVPGCIGVGLTLLGLGATALFGASKIDSSGLSSKLTTELDKVDASAKTGVNKINTTLSGIKSPTGGNLNAGTFTLPKNGYARGTVVPPNRPHLAWFGDNKQEPEIVSPVSTMKQAFTEAMIEMGGNFGGGNTEVVLEIDGREFGRAVVEQGNRENRRIGTRLVIA